MVEALAAVDDADTRHDVTVERAFMAELGSGCSLPIGAHVDHHRLYTFLADDHARIAVSDTIELSGGDVAADVANARRAAREAHRHVAGR